jgi:hypothetical protein
MATPDFQRQMRARIEQELAVRRWADALGLRLSPEEVEDMVRRNSRKRPPGMAPAVVEPPRGPKPLADGAAAPLEFD